MMPPFVNSAALVPPPAYYRAQERLGPALHIDALTLVTTLHLLALCRLAVRLARHRCPPPLPSGPGGASRTYSEASLLLIAPLPWHAACRSGKMVTLESPALRSNASVANRQEPRCRKRSLSSAS